MKKINSRIIVGDSFKKLKTLPDKSIQCCVTSPPYWGLRDYGVSGQLGLEKTPDEYVAKMVAIFLEVKRVLRNDGTLWLNLGDSYSGGGRGCNTPKQQSNKGTLDMPESIVPEGLKPKDLVGIPWRVAMALQKDGWYLRSDIIWSKPNPMPESVTDRPTKAHEYIFLLSKSAQYFYDADAVREPHVTDSNIRTPGEEIYANEARLTPLSPNTREFNHPNGRNKRTVWNIATQPYPDAHFAVFPEKLVEPCILAGTSEKGACPVCAAPWERVVETGHANRLGESWHDHKNNLARGHRGCPPADNAPVKTTTGWKPTCNCTREKTVPCVVLDPFAGAGTVGVVCKRLRRGFIGIELNPEYIEIAEKRIKYCHRIGLKTRSKKKNKRGFF